MNPYGGPKPFKLRNPRLVTLYSTRNGKQKHVNCFKFDVMKDEKGRITDYVCTAKEHGDYFTATVFPARSWCDKEGWEKRPKVPRAEKAAAVEEEQEATSTPPASKPPAAPPAAPASPEPPSAGLTITGIEDGDEEEVSPEEIAALNKAPIGTSSPVPLDVELPGEYNPWAHVGKGVKNALGTPEDLVKFDAKVAMSTIEQEAKRKVEQMKHKREMQDALIRNKAAFMPGDSG